MASSASRIATLHAAGMASPTVKRLALNARLVLWASLADRAGVNAAVIGILTLRNIGARGDLLELIFDFVSNIVGGGRRHLLSLFATHR